MNARQAKIALRKRVSGVRCQVRSRTKDGRRATDNRQRTFPVGFTLLELMVVLTLIMILASFAVPTYTTAIRRAREAVLRDDLYTMRHLIDEYTVDKQQPPAALQDLVDAGYLRGGIPVDPMTGSSETWKVDIEDVPTSSDQAQSGVVDVHSGSDATALDGTHYSDW